MSGSFIRRLRRDRRGSTLAEFAIISPVMILLITGTIEAAHYLMVQVTLEGAVTQAARENSVALALDEDTRDQAMRDRITTAMRAYPSAYTGPMVIETKVFGSFEGVTPEAFEDTNGNGVYDDSEPFSDRNGNGIRDQAAQISGTMGGVGDVVSYKVTYPVKPYFPFLKPIFGESMDIISSTVARNEPEKSSLLEAE